MDTYEARSRVLDLAQEVRSMVERLVSGVRLSSDERQRLREIVGEARAVLSDAGYPAEGVWRALQRVSLGVDTLLDQSDPFYWQDVSSDLQAGIETLESLLSPHLRRDADFRIVG
jgi:hypothetical protein